MSIFDHKIISPARRSQRCFRSLIVLGLAGVAVIMPIDWTLAEMADIFRSSLPGSKEPASVVQPHTAAAPGDNTSTQLVRYSSAGSLAVKVAKSE